MFILPSAPRVPGTCPISVTERPSSSPPHMSSLPLADLCLVPVLQAPMSLPKRHLFRLSSLRSRGYFPSHHLKLPTPYISPSDIFLLIDELMVCLPTPPRAGTSFVLFTIIFQSLDIPVAGRVPGTQQTLCECLWTRNINFYSSVRWELLSPHSTGGN